MSDAQLIILILIIIICCIVILCISVSICCCIYNRRVSKRAKHALSIIDNADHNNNNPDPVLNDNNHPGNLRDKEQISTLGLSGKDTKSVKSEAVNPKLIVADDDIDAAQTQEGIVDEPHKATMGIKDKTTQVQIIDNNQESQNEHGEGRMEYEDVADNPDQDEEYDSNDSNQFFIFMGGSETSRILWIAK